MASSAPTGRTALQRPEEGSDAFQPLRVKEVEQQGGEVEDEAEQSVNGVDDEWASRTMRRRRAFAVLKEEEKANRASPEPGSGRDGAGGFYGFMEVMAQ